MKQQRIFVRYYSRLNLGDDLFLLCLAESFPSIRFDVASDPRFFGKLKNRPRNLKSGLYGYIYTAMSHLAASHASLRPLHGSLEKRRNSRPGIHITIGGSLFAEKAPSSVSEWLPQGNTKGIKLPPESGLLFDEKALSARVTRFTIGANIGPIYTRGMLDSVRSELAGNASVCLRDRYSCSLCDGMENVFYAPDVIFGLKNLPKATECAKKQLVISVVDTASYSGGEKLEGSYYSLLESVIRQQSDEFSIHLVTFCEKEGDLRGAERLQSALGDEYRGRVSVDRYDGDTEKLLRIFASADYVIASRFHSMILGMLFGKPVFPFCFSAKTTHYLEDLGFCGKTATGGNISVLTNGDVMYNYENSVISDCEAHIENAHLQFAPLRAFIGETERRKTKRKAKSSR